MINWVVEKVRKRPIGKLPCEGFFFAQFREKKTENFKCFSGLCLFFRGSTPQGSAQEKVSFKLESECTLC